jgi:DnaJ-class molecular chaperone
MLLKQITPTAEEKHCYRVATSAATGVSLLEGFMVCNLCEGCGLLPHPITYLHVATCYMCNGTGIVGNDQDQFDVRGVCNANAKTLSA